MKGREIIIGKIAIDENDFESRIFDIRRDDVSSILEERLGGGWRLPTIDESRYIRSIHDLGIGDFENFYPPFNYLMKKTETGDGNWINSYNIKTKYLSSTNRFRIRLVKNL